MLTVEDSRQRPPAVVFLKLFERCQRGFNDVPIVPLAQTVHRYISLFFCVYALIGMFEFILYSSQTCCRTRFSFLLSFYSVSHSLEHYIASVFQNRRDVIRVDHRTDQKWFSNAASIFCSDEKSFAAYVVTRILVTMSWIVCAQRQSADVRYDRVLRVDALVASLQLRETSNLTDRFFIAPVVRVLFACGFLCLFFFRSRCTLTQSTCTWLVHITPL